uniref:Prolyl 4-hydroxylase alpha-subunit N-terminal domain-containing protein n=1 Tax=Graphocephala atropunctata TaxID=36148 RepID=A0A1B6KE57_9HEMI
MAVETLVFLISLVFHIASAMDANAPLHMLDHRIFDELSEPTETLGRGDLVLKEMIAYYCNLYDVFNYLKMKDEKGLEMIDVLEKEGGPKLPSMEVNGEAIKRAYKWQDRELEMVTTMLASIKSLWSKVTDKVYQFSSSLNVPHRF